MSDGILAGQKVLLAGCGDIGTGLGLRLLDHGAEVCGLRRDPAHLPDSFERMTGDFSDSSTLAGLKGRAFDHVVITLTPQAYDDAAYEAAYVDGLRNLLGALDPQPGGLVFVSSTSVYHQDDHKWVDETSPTEPTLFSGRHMLTAEGMVAASGMPFTNVRASGIYGPGRLRLVEQIRGGTLCGPADRLYSNRIHREDLVGFLGHLILQRAGGESWHDIYIATDSHSATMWDVQSWLARQLGLDPFTLQPADMTGRTSKRCRNTRLRESGYELVYPDFMRGYEALLSES